MNKSGSIYLLSRKVTGDTGEPFMQNVTVFASNPEHARTIVSEQFTRLRQTSKSKEAAYQELPSFAIANARPAP